MRRQAQQQGPTPRAPLDRARLQQLSSPLAAILFCWLLFLSLLLYAWTNAGFSLIDIWIAGQSFGLAFQIPGMLPAPDSGAVLSLFHRSIPLMLSYFPIPLYQGPWTIYTLAPFVALGGGTLAPLRAYCACLFCLALWGTYRLAEAVYRNGTIGFLAALVLAVNPTLVIYSEEYLHFALGLAASAWTLYLGLRFARERRPRHLLLACAAFFAGLGSAAWFAALGVGLLLCLALSPRRWLALLPRRPRPRFLLLGGCALCAVFFMLPIIAYNVSTGGQTFKFLADHASQRPSWTCTWSDGSCSNLAYWINLKGRLAELATFPAGGGARALTSLPPYWSVYAGLLLLSFFNMARSAWRRRSLASAQAAIWLTALGYLLISPFSPTDQFLSHLMPLAPLLAVLLPAWPAAVTGRARRAGLVLAGLLCAAQFAGDFRLLDGDHLNNGEPIVARNLLEACRWTQGRQRAPVISTSLPFMLAVPYFSQNQARLGVSPAQARSWMDWYLDHSQPDYWKGWLRRRDKPFFIVESPPYDWRPAAALQAAAAQDGRSFTLVKSFPGRSGRPAYEVYVAR